MDHWFEESRWSRKIRVAPKHVVVVSEGTEYGVAYRTAGSSQYWAGHSTAEWLGVEPLLQNPEHILEASSWLAGAPSATLSLYEVMAKRSISGNGTASCSHLVHRLSAELSIVQHSIRRVWQYGETEPDWERLRKWVQLHLLEPVPTDVLASPFGAGLTIVFERGSGGVLLHEALGHRVEGVEGEALLGDQVASNVVNVTDSPVLANGYGSYEFDDYGTPGGVTFVVRQGTVCNTLRDGTDGQPSTGNARCESFRDLPISRMSNICLLPGGASEDECVEQARRAGGLLVRSIAGGLWLGNRVELVLNEAYRSTRGKWIPVPRVPIFLPPTVLRHVSAIGSRQELLAGRCVRARQSLPVGTACPTLLLEGVIVE